MGGRPGREAPLSSETVMAMGERAAQFPDTGLYTSTSLPSASLAAEGGRLHLAEDLIASVRRTAAAGADIVVLLTNSLVCQDYLALELEDHR